MSAARDGRTQQGRDGRGPNRGTPPAAPGQDQQPQAADPYLDETYARDPYAQDPYGQDPYAQDPYAQDPYPQNQQQQYPQQAQQYGQDPYAQDPYAQPQQQPQQYAQPQQPYHEQPYQQPPYPEQYSQEQAYQQQYSQEQYSQEQNYQQPGYAAPQYPQQPQQPYQQPYQEPPPPQQPYGGGVPDGATVPGFGPAQTPQGFPQGYGPSVPQPAQPPAAEVGVDELLSNATRSKQDSDPYAYLFRESDQASYAPGWYGEAGGGDAEATGTIPLLRFNPMAPPPPGAVAGTPTAPAEAKPAGRGGGILGSSAIMAAGTLVSRGTGFVRTMIITFAIGVGAMGDSYNVANTLPTLLYILVGGGALNAVFVPQLVRSMKNDEDGGEAYANRLLTLIVVGLGGVVFVTVLAAPLLVRLVSASIMRDPQSADVTVALARYCLPTIFFMGVHVVMGQILNARGRFGAMMWTPVLNNVVVIFTFGMYAWVYGSFNKTGVTPHSISPEGARLLGIGTLLGLTVQALSMIPYLRAAGFRFRPRFDWRGHGLGHAAKLAKWTFLFVLANQAGYLVVTQLATAAGNASGRNGAGLSAYSNALLIWQLPQAVITVSVMSAVLPRISRAAADGRAAAVRDDLSYGLRTSAVAIVPGAFLFLALGPVIGSVIYGFGNSSQGTSVGWMLSAFALGLIPYSAQYVLLRGFYAYEDTRTPFYNTVWVAASNALLSGFCYLVLPADWAVTGMAFAYGFSYLVGLLVALPRLKRRIGDLDGPRCKRTYGRLIAASILPAVLGFAVSTLIVDSLGQGLLPDIAALVVGAGLQIGLFVVIAQRMRIEELNGLIGMVRSKLGR
ncbi:murein biosynthesis integral membrane protein MurJ [Streptacidiphilus carbonis]|uniref:murein biosynthesis integral membrane protein MurJ n=1 Tax=Streptacidiphilus carbonis TaxID=105422 RepID=UPI0005A8DA81|nr:murein biosynthesis integral membrane protein MurJ [Streptacidiphilus carbonis]